MPTNKEIDLLATTDAMVWAEEFVKIKNKQNWTLSDIDEGLMVAWFANAMAAQEFKARAQTCRNCKWWELYLRICKEPELSDMDTDGFFIRTCGPDFGCCHFEGRGGE